MTKIPYVAHILDWTGAVFLDSYSDSPSDPYYGVERNAETPVKLVAKPAVTWLRQMAKEAET